MHQLSKRQTAVASYHLADYLLGVYQSEQIPELVDEFSRAGFTKETLVQDPDALFRMGVIAAYDRRPFTHSTGGYDAIWEIDGKGRGVPSLLTSAGLWSQEAVQKLSLDEIGARLSSLELGSNSMGDDGGFTQFSRTLTDVADLLSNEFRRRLLAADTPKAIDGIYRAFTSVHGIGETIASKLVKYLLREITLGRAQPESFPLTVAWPIVEEYHADRGAFKFLGLNANLIPLTAGILLKKGDVYAIDALFFLHRNRSGKLDLYIDELRRRLEASWD